MTHYADTFPCSRITVISTLRTKCFEDENVQLVGGQTGRQTFSMCASKTAAHILPTPDLATHAAKLERSLPFSHFSSLCVFSYLNSDLCLPSTVSLNMSGVFSYKCGSRYICPTSIHSTWHVNKHPTALGRWPAAVNTGLEAATKITALNHAGRRLCTDYTQKIPP